MLRLFTSKKKLFYPQPTLKESKTITKSRRTSVGELLANYSKIQKKKQK